MNLSSMNLSGIVAKRMSGQNCNNYCAVYKQYKSRIAVYRLGEVLLANNCEQCTNQTIIISTLRVSHHHYPVIHEELEK